MAIRLSLSCSPLLPAPGRRTGSFCSTLYHLLLLLAFCSSLALRESFAKAEGASPPTNTEWMLNPDHRLDSGLGIDPDQGPKAVQKSDANQESDLGQPKPSRGPAQSEEHPLVTGQPLEADRAESALRSDALLYAVLEHCVPISPELKCGEVLSTTALRELPEGAEVLSSPESVISVEAAIDGLARWLEEEGAAGLSEGAVLEHYSVPGMGSFQESPTFENHPCSREGDTSNNEKLCPRQRARPELGLRATEAVELDQVLLYFPSNLLVSADRLAEDEPQNLPYDIEKESSFWTSFSVVAAWLLRERAKGRSSFWYPFLRVLPNYVHCGVLFDIDVLKASNLRLKELILQILVPYKTEYDKCSRESVANASFSEFVWALSIVGSRAFSSQQSGEDSLPGNSNLTLETSGNPSHAVESTEVPQPSSEDSEHLPSGVSRTPSHAPNVKPSRFESPIMLVPYVDLLNHDTDNNAAWQVMPDGMFIIAQRPIPPGEAVTVSYGAKSTEEYLAGYGFAPSPNPHDYYPLFADLEGAMKFFFDNFAGGSVSSGQACHVGGGANFSHFLLWARAVADRAQVNVAREREKEEYKMEFMLHPTWTGGDAKAFFLVWHGGRVEPALLAVLASLAFYCQNNGSELDYGVLAEALVPYGLVTEDADCERMSAWLRPSVVEAVGVAAQLVRKRTEETLREDFVSATEEEKETLRLLDFCRGEHNPDTVSKTMGSAGTEVKGSKCSAEGGNEEVCAASAHEEGTDEDEEEVYRVFNVTECASFGDKNLRQLKKVLEFQVAKAMLIEEVRDRMAWTCDPEYESYRRAILHGEEVELAG